MRGEIYRLTPLSACTVVLASAMMLILSLSGYCMSQETVERCKMTKPSKTQTCPGNKTSRWFFHDTKGCKRSGFCDPEDTDVYDEKDNLNYFLSKEACIEICHMHIKCPTLEPIANGSVSNNGEGHWGSSVVYTCDKGFVLQGTAVRRCERDGTWTSAAPVCRAQCQAPNMDESFRFSPEQELYNPGDSIVYSCESGYGQVADSNTGRTCLEDGSWSGGEISCELEAQCSDDVLTPIAHGTLTAPQGVSIGSIVTFSCNEGYGLFGSSSIECQESRNWTGAQPICWKLTIEMCKEDNPDEARNDVTNTIQYLNEGERNIWFIPQVSEPNPFPSEVATWDQEITSLPSVTVEGGKLKISMISKALTTGMEEKEYNVAFAGFKASFKLRVNDMESVPKRPESIVPLPNQRKALGDDLTFHCIFKGCPSPNITWEHNGQRVTEDEKTTIILSEEFFVSSTLTIKEIEAKHAGRYRCVGQNLEGSDFSNEGTVSLTQSSSSQSSFTNKRSIAAEESSLCRSQAPSDTVTIVGRVKRESVRSSTPLATAYHVKIVRIISPNSSSLTKRSMQTFVFDTNVEAQHKLDTNELYIIQGKVQDSTSLVSTRDSILNHSLELEQSLRQC